MPKCLNKWYDAISKVESLIEDWSWYHVVGSKKYWTWYIQITKMLVWKDLRCNVTGILNVRMQENIENYDQKLKNFLESCKCA